MSQLNGIFLKVYGLIFVLKTEAVTKILLQPPLLYSWPKRLVTVNGTDQIYHMGDCKKWINSQSLVRIFESGDIHLLPVVESKSYTEKDK